MSEPWGRWVEEQVMALGDAIESLGGSIQNDGRTSSSGMDNMSASIAELFARQSIILNVPEVSVSPPIEAWVSAEVDVTLPPPVGGDRLATLLISAITTISSGSAAYAFVEVLINGSQAIVFQANPNRNTGAPAATFEGTAMFRYASDTIVTVRLWGDRFVGAPAGTLSLTEASLSVTPNQLL